VGKPVHVKQNPNPTKEEIEEVQTRYIEELMK
jgi:2-acylglycerol O-acyltransferase 2